MAGGTVADVLVEGARSAGAAHLFVSGEEPLAALHRAAERRALPLVHFPGTPTACLVAAVTGEITGAPGFVVIRADAVGQTAEALTYAARAHAPLLVVAVGADAVDVPEAARVSLDLVPEAAGARLGRALNGALTPPAGPVLVQVALADLTAPGGPAAAEPGQLRPALDPDALDRAAALLADASHPVTVAGLDARSAEVSMWLRPFAESLPAPDLVTPKARGVLADPHPLLLGVIGGPGAAPTLLAQADLIVALGLDPRELRSEDVHSARVLSLGPIGLDGATHAVIGEIGAILEELAPRLRGRARADWDVAELHRLKRGVATPASGAVSASEVLALAREVTASRTIAVIDGGLGPVTITAGWQTTAPHELLLAVPPAPRGFGLAAAMAAQLAHRDRRVLCLIGSEVDSDAFDALMRLALPIVILRLGSAAVAAEPRGVRWIPAGEPRGLAKALPQALVCRGPVVIDVGPV